MALQCVAVHFFLGYHMAVSSKIPVLVYHKKLINSVLRIYWIIFPLQREASWERLSTLPWKVCDTRKNGWTLKEDTVEDPIAAAAEKLTSTLFRPPMARQKPLSIIAAQFNSGISPFHVPFTCNSFRIVGLLAWVKGRAEAFCGREWCGISTTDLSDNSRNRRNAQVRISGLESRRYTWHFQFNGN